MSVSIPRTAVRWAAQHGIARVLVARGLRRGEPQAQLIGDPAVRLDPYPVHAAVRARGPLVPAMFGQLSATHAVVGHVLRSSDFGVLRDGSDLPAWLRSTLRWSGEGAPSHPMEPPSLLAVDPPEHTRYRRLVSSVFTARAIAGLRDQVQAVADRLLDELVARDEPVVDLVEHYAARLPLVVIADILDIPADEHDRVLELGGRTAASLDLGIGFRGYHDSQRALAQFDELIDRHLTRLRAEPGDDLLSRLVTASDGGEQLTQRELRSLAGLLLAAGFETTVNLLGSGTRLLLEHPDQLAVLRADESLWPNAVEELLRLESPAQVTSRTALRDTEVAGVPVPRHTRVVCFLGGANRDPDAFERPDEVDVRRPNAAEHLAFSAGRHFCLGAALARLEGEIGLRSLLTRFPDLALAPGAVRRPTRVLRGWAALPVRLGSTRPASSSPSGTAPPGTS